MAPALGLKPRSRGLEPPVLVATPSRNISTRHIKKAVTLYPLSYSPKAGKTGFEPATFTIPLCKRLLCVPFLTLQIYYIIFFELLQPALAAGMICSGDRVRCRSPQGSAPCHSLSRRGLLPSKIPCHIGEVTRPIITRSRGLQI